MQEQATPAEDHLMVWTIRDPPDDSCFILDKDDQGDPRLSWNLPDGPHRDAGKAFVSFFLVVWILVGLVVAILLVVEVIALFRGGRRPAAIVGGCFWLVIWSGAAYCLARILHKVPASSRSGNAYPDRFCPKISSRLFELLSCSGPKSANRGHED
jgi:hypothetical protein